MNLEESSLFAEVCDTTLHTLLPATNLHGSRKPSDGRVGGELELSLSDSMPTSGLFAGSGTVSVDREGSIRVDSSQKGTTSF